MKFLPTEKAEGSRAAEEQAALSEVALQSKLQAKEAISLHREVMHGHKGMHSWPGRGRDALHWCT